MKKTKESLFDVEPTIQKIIKFNKVNFVTNKILVPNGAEISFYEKTKDNYIERYSIAKNDRYESLLLDSFYPKELDSFMEKYIIKAINGNLYYYMEKNQSKSDEEYEKEDEIENNNDD